MSSLIDHMIVNDWITRKEILGLFEQCFMHGCIGFHLCSSDICKDENEIMEYMCDLFDLPHDSDFFHVVSCECNKMAVYIDPAVIRKYVPCDTVRYCYDPKTNHAISKEKKSG